MMNGAVANPDAPNLGVWSPGQKSLRGNKAILGYLERETVHVNGNDFSLVSIFNLSAYDLLVNFVAPAGVLFFAVMWLGHCHLHCSWQGAPSDALYHKQPGSWRRGKRRPGDFKVGGLSALTAGRYVS
jgi:hypothetical protein